MTIELDVPNSWSPGQALAVRDLLQKVLRAGHPIIAAVRPDATPDQVEDIYGQLWGLLRAADLAA
jgi:hypothetical protein